MFADEHAGAEQPRPRNAQGSACLCNEVVSFVPSSDLSSGEWSFVWNNCLVWTRMAC